MFFFRVHGGASTRSGATAHGISVGFKLWGAIPLTLIFAFANIPMLLKHDANGDKAVTDRRPKGNVAILRHPSERGISRFRPL